MSKESTKLRNELDKLYGLIVGKNVLQSPLDFWERYDAWREAVKGLEKAIREMEGKMERLTHERVNGIKTGYWSPEKKETLVNALAEYENTGLTPEEIKMLNGKGADAPANDAWIPVEERLPEEKRANYEVTFINECGYEEHGFAQWYDGEFHIPAVVIAWRDHLNPYCPEKR